MEPTLQNVIGQTTLKWIFVGGKGGVGKTTCSCSLAVQLSKVRDSVLIVSTDPAHNISDVFDQKFSSVPTAVKGFSNLFAMEVEQKTSSKSSPDVEGVDGENDALRGFVDQETIESLSVIKEAMCYSEVMKVAKGMNSSVVVFDSEPTGHTLRLLPVPRAIKKWIETLSRFKMIISPLMTLASATLGITGMNADSFVTNLEYVLATVVQVNEQLVNPEHTTFVCVCTAEFLSLYETEQLVQELTKFRIDARNIVVNKLLYPTGEGNNCRMCSGRLEVQEKYLDQISDLYEDFHVTKLPLVDREVRGSAQIVEFSRNLVRPYNPDQE